MSENKAAGLSYTQEEDYAIVHYLVDTDQIEKIKGDAVWKEMESANVVNRTWQSLKQHFKKHIAYELRYPRYKLDSETIARFNQAKFKETLVKEPRYSREHSKSTRHKLPKSTRPFAAELDISASSDTE